MEIWRLKGEIDRLNSQLKVKPIPDSNRHEARHCPICSDGEVVRRMEAIVRNVEEEH